MTGKWVYYGLPYMELLPKNYECFSQDSWQKCEPSYFCGLDIKHRVKEEAGVLHNWAELLSLECQSKGKIGMLSAAFMLGYASSVLWIPHLADKYGRSIVYKVTTIASTILIGAIFFTHNITTMTLILLFIGFFTSGSGSAAAYVYLMEFMP